MSTLTSVAIAAASLMLVGCSSANVAQTSDVSTPKSTSASATAATPAMPIGAADRGSVQDTSEVRCVEDYSPRAIAGRGFAFDGTVVEIGNGTTDRPGKGRLNYSGVTFAVANWFVGGPTSMVTIDMPPPRESSGLDGAPSTYQVGTRLLVSGESRWGEGYAHDGLAWGCGFTRYHDAETADVWADATN